MISGRDCSDQEDISRSCSVYPYSADRDKTLRRIQTAVERIEQEMGRLKTQDHSLHHQLDHVKKSLSNLSTEPGKQDRKDSCSAGEDDESMAALHSDTNLMQAVRNKSSNNNSYSLSQDSYMSRGEDSKRPSGAGIQRRETLAAFHHQREQAAKKERKAQSSEPEQSYYTGRRREHIYETLDDVVEDYRAVCSSSNEQSKKARKHTVDIKKDRSHKPVISNLIKPHHQSADRLPSQYHPVSVSRKTSPKAGSKDPPCPSPQADGTFFSLQSADSGYNSDIIVCFGIKMLRVQARYEETDPEVEAMAKEELAKLQRQFRIMEESRKTYTDQAQNEIRKQQIAMEKLEDENKDLKKDLSLAGSRQNELKDESVCEQFETLFDKKSHFEALVGEDERLVAQLEKNARHLEQKIKQERKEMGGVHMTQQQHIVAHKRIRVLENKLDTALKKFNSGLASNAALRSRIDHLRQERQVFDHKHNKLEKELKECKREMGEIIEMSTQAYDTRDDAQTKMVALRDKMEKELKQYNAEIKELIRVIEHDRKLKEFMSKKDQERTEAHEEIEAMRRRREAEKAEERDRTVMSYETGFKCIQEATGITDIDQLVTKFIEVEDQNFALFNYVNELNNDIESLQEAIAEVKREIEAFKNQGVELEERRKVILRQMEGELTASSEQKAKSDSNVAATTRVIEQLKSGVESLFNKIGCDSTTITDMLGGQAGVTDSNVLQYMGIIEQRANELLQLSAFVQAKDSDDPAILVTFLQGRAPKHTQGSIAAVQPPSSKDDYDSDASIEEEGKPLTQEELRSRLAKRGTQRREKHVELRTSPVGTAAASTRGSERKKLASTK